jgi:hypothetical protein
MKIHKLEDGDIIKILPMIDKNNKISWVKPYDATFVGTSTIYDNSGKSYLRRISHKLRESKLIHHSSTKLQIATRHGMNIYIDGEIRILNVSKTLFEMITNNPNLLDIRGNHQLFVVKKEVSVGGGQVFPSFDKSYVSEKNWTPPVNDMNSQDEWLSYIKSNQPDFDTHIEKNSIFNHKQLLIDHLGKDMLSELISEDREKKLETLLK